MSERGGAPQGLARALQDLVRQLGLRPQLQRQQVLASWDRVVGPEIAARARPYRLTAGELWVRVDHAGWAQQLAFLKAVIVRDLNAAAGAEVVRDIRFVAGRPGGGKRDTGPGEALPGPRTASPGQGMAGGRAPAGSSIAALGSPAAAGAPPAGSAPAQVAAAGGSPAGEVPGPGPAGEAGQGALPPGLAGSLAGVADAQVRQAAARWLAAAWRRRQRARRRGWPVCPACGCLYPPGPATPRGLPGAARGSKPGHGTGSGGRASGGRAEPAGHPAAAAAGPAPGEGTPTPAGAGGRPPGRHGGVAGREGAGEAAALCPACRARREEDLRRRVRAMLARDPWLSYPEVASLLGEPVARLYREERAALLAEWRARLRFWAVRLQRGEAPPAEARGLLIAYALLRSGRSPDRLDGAAAREAVGPRLEGLYDYFFAAPGREAAVTGRGRGKRRGPTGTGDPVPARAPGSRGDPGGPGDGGSG